MRRMGHLSDFEFSSSDAFKMVRKSLNLLNKLLKLLELTRVSTQVCCSTATEKPFLC